MTFEEWARVVGLRETDVEFGIAVLAWSAATVEAQRPKESPRTAVFTGYHLGDQS